MKLLANFYFPENRLLNIWTGKMEAKAAVCTIGVQITSND
jgi:hypothetical protein